MHCDAVLDVSRRFELTAVDAQSHAIEPEHACRAQPSCLRTPRGVRVHVQLLMMTCATVDELLAVPRHRRWLAAGDSRRRGFSAGPLAQSRWCGSWRRSCDAFLRSSHLIMVSQRYRCSIHHRHTVGKPSTILVCADLTLADCRMRK